jgi:hypothetical protein
MVHIVIVSIDFHVLLGIDDEFVVNELFPSFVYLKLMTHNWIMLTKGS